MGVITAYDLKQDLYTIQYTNRKQERVSHKDVLLIYCPPTKRVDKDILLKEIEAAQDSNLDKRSPVEKLEDLAGRTFLMDIKDDGTRDRVKIKQVVEGIDRFKKEVEKDPKRIKMLVQIGNKEKTEELMTYAEILDFIERNNESGNDGVYWKFRKIISHRRVKDGSVDNGK